MTLQLTVAVGAHMRITDLTDVWLIGHNMTLFSVGYFPIQPIMLHNKHDVQCRVSWHGTADWAWVLGDGCVNLRGRGLLLVTFLGLEYHFGQCQRSGRHQRSLLDVSSGEFYSETDQYHHTLQSLWLWSQRCVPSGFYQFNYNSIIDLLKHIFFCKMGHFLFELTLYVLI